MLLFLLFHIPRTTFTTIGGIPTPQEIIVISRVITRKKEIIVCCITLKKQKHGTSNAR